MNEDKEVAYLPWNDGKALSYMNDSVQAYDGIQKASAYSSTYGPRTFVGVDTNLSIRSDFNRGDYNYYRPSEAVPCDIQGIIRMCMRAYDRIGLVRQAIDLMGDFACQGINLVHPNKKIEKFYQKWFKKVNGPERSERFLNMFYRAGNVVVYRLDGKIQLSMVEDWRKTHGADGDIEFEKISTNTRIIPAKYVFYHPLSVDVIGSPLSTFSGKPFYALKVNAELRSAYHALNNQVQRSPEASIILNNIPSNIANVLKGGGNYVSLDQDKISAYHYKKDDWQIWANPMLYSVLDDLIHLEKLKLADSAALDGAISNIRLWNLGVIDTANPNNSIMPTKVAVNKLRNILSNNVGGGTLDLVWGPELKFTESNSQVHNYLGPEKYTITLSNIYVGLGIPPVLAGGTKDGGFTNNYITIKTLIERLEYGRSVLVNFWNGEIERVQKAMGFRFPAQITFDQLILSDEAAEKKLLMDLVDRDLISAETLRGKFDIPNEIEEIRIKRDEQKRGENAPHKASPFHNPQQEHEMKKLLVQRGTVAPSEIGVKLNPRKEGEKTPNEDLSEMQIKLAKQNNKAKVAQQGFKPKKPNGRPKTSKDKNKRKKKRVLPRTKGNDFVTVYSWASEAYKTVSDLVVPTILGALNKDNLRKLTAYEANQLDMIKFNLLCNFNPFDNITQEKVYSLLEEDNLIKSEVADYYQDLLRNHIDNNNNKEPTLEVKKNLQITAYSMFYSSEEDDGDN